MHVSHVTGTYMPSLALGCDRLECSTYDELTSMMRTYMALAMILALMLGVGRGA